MTPFPSDIQRLRAIEQAARNLDRKIGKHTEPALYNEVVTLRALLTAPSQWITGEDEPDQCEPWCAIESEPHSGPCRRTADDRTEPSETMQDLRDENQDLHAEIESLRFDLRQLHVEVEWTGGGF